MTKPCAWCDSDTMDWNASPNGKDICNDCEDNATDPDACQTCGDLIAGGNPFSTHCDNCLDKDQN